MGWDTQVGVLIENIVEEKESVLALFLNNPPLIYSPFKVYEKEMEESVGKKQVLYLCYQGRKHPPVRWFDKIACVHPNLSFTLLGSHLDFISGPAGLIRLKAGIILDSYGYFDRFRADEEYLNPEMIYQWFRVDGLEESIRQNHLPEISKCQHDDDLVSRLILLNEEEKILLAATKLKLANAGVEYGWKEVEIDWS